MTPVTVCAAREAEAEAMLLADEQQKQRRRDIESMERRLDELDDEEAREIDGDHRPLRRRQAAHHRRRRRLRADPRGRDGRAAADGTAHTTTALDAECV